MDTDNIASDTHKNDAKKVASERASKVEGFDRLIEQITMLNKFAANHAPLPCHHSDFVEGCACCWFWMIYRWTKDVL